MHGDLTRSCTQTLRGATGKTEEFTQQIEEHQRELAPWTAKITAKQSEVDMAQSEHDLLREKADSLTTSYEDALNTLDMLKKSQESKGLEIMELQDSIDTSAGQIASMKQKLKVYLINFTAAERYLPELVPDTLCLVSNQLLLRK